MSQATLTLKPDHRATMLACAAELEAATQLRIGVMDSDSKRARIEQERMDIVRRVIEKLRAA